ncbi:hypothetical protein AB7M17_004011 [Bradyrhizobium sp. USDA 377]
MIQAAGRMAVTIGSDAIVPLHREERPLVRGELATPALQAEHHQMIIEPMQCAGINARMC